MNKLLNRVCEKFIAIGAISDFIRVENPATPVGTNVDDSFLPEVGSDGSVGLLPKCFARLANLLKLVLGPCDGMLSSIAICYAR